MNKNIAFVCSPYNEKIEIEHQLKEKNIINIDVFSYSSEPKGYEVIEYNIRPNKTHGEILDLAQCLQSHGFPDDKYIPPERKLFSEENKEVIDTATRHLRLENLKLVLEPDEVKEVTRELYELRIEQIKNNKKRFSELTTHELSAKIDLEEDPMIIIAITTVLFDKIHCIDMIDNWGNNTRGYRAKNDKDVKGFMNAKSIGWISELWSELLPQQTEYNQRKFLKSLRTRAKNMLRDKSSIYALRFFIEWLIEQEKETVLSETTTEDTEIVYEGFEEDDIPF